MVSYCVQGCASEWISEPEVKVFYFLDASNVNKIRR
jgi:hypothetical protein